MSLYADICIINICDIYPRTEHATRGLEVKSHTRVLHTVFQVRNKLNVTERKNILRLQKYTADNILNWGTDKDVETRRHFQNYTQWRLKCAKIWRLVNSSCIRRRTHWSTAETAISSRQKHFTLELCGFLVKLRLMLSLFLLFYMTQRAKTNKLIWRVVLILAPKSYVAGSVNFG